LHERIGIIEKEGNQYIMPDKTELVFYHFSTYKYSRAENIAVDYDRFGFKDDLILEKMYKDYLKKILDNNIKVLSQIECIYVTKRREYLKSIYKQKPLVKRIVKRIFKFPYRLMQKIY